MSGKIIYSRSTKKHDELTFFVEMPEGIDDLVRVIFQSRRSNTKSYVSTLQFHITNTTESVQDWCYTCTVGLRVVGCYSHLCALL